MGRAVVGGLFRAANGIARFRGCASMWPRPPLVRGRALIRVHATGRLDIGEGFVVDATPLPSQFIVGPNAQMKFGVDCFVNYGCDLHAAYSVTFGDNCMIGPQVYVLDDAWHETAPGSRRFAPIVVGTNVWLSRGVAVLPGVTIGDHTVVASGAVVTKSLPDRVLAAGVPAVPLRTIDVPDRSWRRS